MTLPLLCTLLIVIGSATTITAAPEVPGRPQERPIALVGGTVHTVAGGEIKDATLLFDRGKIVAIGSKLPLPKDVQEIDVRGKHVYPGLIDAYTQVGLIEIGAVRASSDQSEVGQINPNAKAQVAFNPDSELIPVGRSNGVLAVLTAPQGSLVSGTSALMAMDGWTWEEMTIKPGVGLHINWPRTVPPPAKFGDSSTKANFDRYQKTVERIRQAFEDARRYLAAREAAGDESRDDGFDARWEAMIPVLRRQRPIIVEADQLGQIQAVVAFAAEQQVRPIILGGYDAPRCAALLKQHDVPVIVGGVHRLPQRQSDPYDTPFTVPVRLWKAGIPFAISGSERPSNVRNLPYQAATAAAFGLPREEALKAITLYPAQILGAQDRIGSLESGKDATLFVADGDILEIGTQVEQAYIQGRHIDLNDRHKRLWHKYQQKYRR